jgi:peptidoglycan/xylan/chitin deacetylase (PgdA/CDA1 family)
MTNTRAGLWLTIDDAPSADCDNKREYLLSKGIPAVFFCTGQELDNAEEPALLLLASGFQIQNHSWSHPRFSSIPPAEAMDQIDRTEAVINRLYKKAGIKRPGPHFRFPYGDKGDGKGDAGKRLLYRRLLEQRGFVPFRQEGTLWPPGHPGDDPDWYWTFDVMEWCLFAGGDKYGIGSEADVLARLSALDETKTPGLILIHDHDETAGVFYRVIDTLLERGYRFNPFLNH